MTERSLYVHHALDCAPRTSAAVAQRIRELRWNLQGGALYGIWRSQIGRPRDELNVITVWSEATDPAVSSTLLADVAEVREIRSEPLRASLRPASTVPPRRQGNYAFRWFELPERHWQEFLALCVAAWPGFESAYDSQIVGLWYSINGEPGQMRALLLTRRPDLSMWERSKTPVGATERKVRELLDRRYDLCTATWVYTTTMLTAEDRVDKVRWS